MVSRKVTRLLESRSLEKNCCTKGGGSSNVINLWMPYASIEENKPRQKPGQDQASKGA